MRELIIYKEDLKFNINEIQSKIPNKQYTIIAVVKGNGYGLDIIQYTKFLEENGINFFAVASYEEAIQLKEAGLKKDLINLTPYIDEKSVENLIDNNVILTIDSETSAIIANKIAKEKNKKIKAHIKIDTGLSRYGFNYKDIEKIKEIINSCSNIEFEGIFSHLSNSLANDKSYSDKQFKRFLNVINGLKVLGKTFKYEHICNSSGFFKYPEMRLNTARIGSAFTGNAYGNENFLKKVGIFHAKIGRIRQIEPGDIVGYGNSFIAKKPMKIAIIHTGYFDGIGLTLENQRFKKLSKIKRAIRNMKNIFKDDAIYLKINNNQYKIIGQIGMFDTVIDITGHDFKENDDVYFYVRPILIDTSIERKYI